MGDVVWDEESEDNRNEKTAKNDSDDDEGETYLATCVDQILDGKKDLLEGTDNVLIIYILP
jgi:hypothetical protein